MPDATTSQRPDRSEPPRFRPPLRHPGARVPAGAAPDGEPSGAQLLRLASNCPRCGSRPALRITGEVARLLADEAQGTRLGTYQCQRRGCGAIYDLAAGEFLEQDPEQG
ncbi:MAG TPA: hypothetical protein VGV85_06660 [Longimicrobiaceae bacterium]|nr:hypothetical protein [Longimicrobiaceae bacterium]